MSETEVLSFSVRHQEGKDLRIMDPAFRYEYGITAPGNGGPYEGIIYEILTSPAGYRSLGINQLSKSPTEETYQGSADFKIWQHAAGLYHAVRHFGRQQGLSEETIVQYALVAMLGDMTSKGVKAHVTDMIPEGRGGTEDFHDRRIQQGIELGGIQNILNRNNIQNPFDGDGGITIDVPPWVECKSPDLSMDRLHYINAEISLMFPHNVAIREAIKLDNFTITEDGYLAFKDPHHALVWAKAANLCSSEHWNEPTNRLIELLSLEGMKRIISMRFLENIDALDSGNVGPPEDYTFLIDKDFDEALESEATSDRPDIFMSAIYSLIQSIAYSERQRFKRHKQPTYEAYIDDPDACEYPNALINPHRAAFGIPPAQVEILHTVSDMDSSGPHEAALQMSEGKTVGVLKRLKVRQFDPQVITLSGPKRLSEIDPNFKRALEENDRALNYVGAVALHVNPVSQRALINGANENATYMEQSRSYPHLSPDQIRGIIRNSATKALELAIREGRWVEL